MTPATPKDAEDVDVSAFVGFTPGPWAVQSFADEAMVVGPIKNDSRPVVADVCLRDEQSANARLIAAAPALLAENARLRARIAELEKGK